MNKLCYRIVCNAQGQIVAVAESARSLVRGRQGGCKAPHLWSGHRLSALAMASAMALVTLTNSATAQVSADPKAAAAQRPLVLRDASNNITVNIQTPSAAGVSLNAYSSFNVPSTGVALNNQRGSNPYIVVPAKIIVNQVNSNAPAQLEGQLSVRGTAADVWVVNPYGVRANNASFWNVNRAVLSTGKPVLESGRLTGIDVTQGDVNIGPAGLNAAGAVSLEVYSRSLTTAGRIFGRDVSVVTGTQHLDLATGRLTSIAADSSTKPLFAIDTLQMGGMYANRITLLTTEEGTGGVRNKGTLQAHGTDGQLVITADGRLENTGTLRATVLSLATVQGDIVNSGSVQASKFLTMASGGDIKFTGRGAAQTGGSDLLISAVRDIEIGSDAELSSNAAGGRLNMTAEGAIKLRERSKIGAAGEMQLTADGSLELASATLSSGVSVVALAGRGITSRDSNLSGPRVHLETGAAFSDVAADLTVYGGKVAGSSQTTLISSGNLSISGQNPLLPVGNVPGCQIAVCPQGDVAPSASNASTAVVRGDGDVHLQAGKNLTVAAGSSVQAGRDLTALAGETLSLLGTPGTTATNGQVARLTAVRDLQLTGGSVHQVGSILNVGGSASIQALSGDVDLVALSNASGASNAKVQIDAGKDLTVSAYQGGLKAAGLTATGQNIHLVSNGITRVDAVTNTMGDTKEVVRSSLSAREDLTVGSISADQQVSIQSSGLQAGGLVRVSGNGEVVVGAVLDDMQAGSNGQDPTNIQGSRIVVQGSSIKTDAVRMQSIAGDIQLLAHTGSAVLGTQSGMGAQLNANGSIAIHGNSGLTEVNTIALASGSFSSTSAVGNIDARNIRVQAKDIVSFASKGSQSHFGNKLTGGAVSLYNDTDSLSLVNTSLQAIAAGGAANSQLSGRVSVESAADLSVDATSVLDAATDLSIIRGKGDLVINPSGTARGTLTQAQLRVGRSLTLGARDGDLVLSGVSGGNGLGSSGWVSLSTTDALNLFGSNVKLQGSQINAGGSVGITATKGNLQVDANLVTNVDGRGASNTQWDAASIKGGHVNLLAAGDTELNAIKVASLGAVSILSGGNTVVAGKHAKVSTVTPIDHGSFTREDKLLVRSSIAGEKGVSVGALGGDLFLNATDAYASLGALKLQASGNIVLEAAQNHTMSNTFTSITKRTWYGKRKTTTTNVHDESLVAAPVTLFGASIELKSGNNVKTYAGRLKSTGDLLVEAGDEALYYAVTDQYDHSVSTSKKSSLFGIGIGSSNTGNSRSTLDGQVTQLQSKGNIVSLSGGSTLLQGTTAEYGGTATFQVGVGEARADAQLILEGVKSSVTQTRTQESNYVVWQKLVNQGSTVETLQMPTFKGPSNPVFIGPVLAQLPAGDFKTQIQALSTQPGMGYLNDLAARKDVQWQEVQLAFDRWNYKQEGLTQAGAALISVAVTWATGGVGAGLVGLSGSTTAGLAANAAFTSLANQASITLINNKGNIGKTLSDLASSATVKATVSAAMTSAVMGQISDLPALKSLKTGSEFTDRLTLNLVDASGRALINTSVTGGNLQEALRTAILSTTIDTAHAAAASQIKWLEADYLAHKIAHAMAGCGAGLAAGSSCRDSAIGSAVGEIVAQMALPKNERLTPSDEASLLAYAKIVAGGTAALVGGNAERAIAAAEISVSNNTLLRNRVTYLAAVLHSKEGNGEAIEVPLSSLDLSDITAADFPNGVGSSEPINLFTKSGARLQDMLVYGTITLKLVSEDKVIATRGKDTYDFDMKFPNSWGMVTRDIMTLGGGLANEFLGNKLVPYGLTRPFTIYLTGSATIGKPD